MVGSTFLLGWQSEITFIFKRPQARGQGCLQEDVKFHEEEVRLYMMILLDVNSPFFCLVENICRTITSRIIWETCFDVYLYNASFSP